MPIPISSLPPSTTPSSGLTHHPSRPTMGHPLDRAELANDQNPPALPPQPTEYLPNSNSTSFPNPAARHPSLPTPPHEPGLFTNRLFPFLVPSPPPYFPIQPYPQPSPYLNTSTMTLSPVPPQSTSSSSLSAQPPKVYSPPTMTSLASSLPDLDRASDSAKLAWAQDVIRVLDRYLQASSGSAAKLTSSTSFQSSFSSRSKGEKPPALEGLLSTAIPIIISLSADQRTSGTSALALYLKAKLLSSGCCPNYLPKDQRQAFKDFEAAARAGEARGWFKLGRDYESVGDLNRARDCFERGVKRDDCEATYRMGMAHLLGQLGLPSDPTTALPLLHHACELGHIDFPIPPYVYGMLLAGELVSPTNIPPHLVLPSTAPLSDALITQHALARSCIERAAYLGHPPAQYKCGFINEHASLGCLYDPLMSVHWYSLASQGGEVEADMALSKWFLCGADPHFQKNEDLARTFADKAARKGHPNGCFAMGYYFELGIGGRRDMDQARKWYQKAAKLDNADAIARLSALSMPHPVSISLQEHQTRLNDTLVRRRTQAKLRSDRNSIRRQNRDSGQLHRLPPISTQSLVTSEPRLTGGSERQEDCHLSNSSSGADGNSKGVRIQSAIPTFHSENSIPMPFPYPYSSSHSSFSRPPIPEQFNTASSAATVDVSINTTNHLGGNEVDDGLGRQILSPGTRHRSLPEREAKRYTLTDTGGGGGGGTGPSSSASAPASSDLGLRQGGGGGEGMKRYDGPQTFAEMGFQSRPVEEEGCVVM